MISKLERVHIPLKTPESKAKNTNEKGIRLKAICLRRDNNLSKKMKRNSLTIHLMLLNDKNELACSFKLRQKDN
jgi:hypothetical protein